MLHWGGLSCFCKHSALALAWPWKGPALALALILMALLTSLVDCRSVSNFAKDWLHIHIAHAVFHACRLFRFCFLYISIFLYSILTKRESIVLQLEVECWGWEVAADSFRPSDSPRLHPEPFTCATHEVKWRHSTPPCWGYTLDVNTQWHKLRNRKILIPRLFADGVFWFMQACNPIHCSLHAYVSSRRYTLQHKGSPKLGTFLYALYNFINFWQILKLLAIRIRRKFVEKYYQ